MEILNSELKRKAVHCLSLLYLLLYWVCPRPVAVGLMTVGLIVVGLTEFLRLRRPELNAWFLNKFGGMHRPDEVRQPSGAFWMLFGCWLTMVIFASKAIVIPALGFVAFGDTLAALVGKTWGRHPWPHHPNKTLEGSASFAAVSILFALVFVRWPVAIVGAAAATWLEARSYPWTMRLWPFSKTLTFRNDNFALPVLGGLVLSIVNLLLGKR